MVDFEGNMINNIYNPSPEYVIQNIHISILPLKTETVITMFIEDGDKRYRRFYKQFNKLPLEDKLAALTYIIFLYSEDMYFSKSIEKEVAKSQTLCNAGQTSQNMLSPTPFFDPFETLKVSHDLSNIKPWAGSTPLERTDFRNGLYLNRLHDGLFDRHLMTIDEDMRIEYAESVRQENVGDTFETFFGRYEGQRIRKPSCRKVDERYLAEHRRISHELWSRT